MKTWWKILNSFPENCTCYAFNKVAVSKFNLVYLKYRSLVYACSYFLEQLTKSIRPKINFKFFSRYFGINIIFLY